MTTHLTSARRASSTWNRNRYWFLTAPLLLIFLVSAALSFLDPDGARRGATLLGFPPFIVVYPLAVAKLAAIGAILWRRSQVLIHFAFAGLLYDMLLALAAHVKESDFPSGWLAVVGLVVWCGAFFAERDRAAHEHRV